MLEAALKSRPQQDHAQLQRALDAQFQFYVTGLLRRATFLASIEEPDIVIQNGINSSSVAVKRIHGNIRRFKRHIKKGEIQIQKRALPGAILLNVTSLLQDSHAIVRAQTADGIPGACQQAILQTLKGELEKAVHTLTSRHVFAVTLYAEFGALIGAPPVFPQCHFETIYTLGGSNPDGARWEQIIRTMSAVNDRAY